MAVKNWLIRTKNKQILGPATKDKVIELIEKGSLTPDDEIASGNGYWFWVRERDLLEKYLYGDLPQTFNPISEAQDVLTAKTTPDGITASVLESPQKAKQKAVSSDAHQMPGDDDLAYPEEDDLAYPDMGEASPPSSENLQDLPGHEDDQEGEFSEEHNETTELDVGAVAPQQKAPPQKPSPIQAAPVETAPSSDDEENFLYPSDEDLEYPDMGGEEEVELEAGAEDEDEDDQTDPNISIPGVDDSEGEAELEDHPDEDHQEIVEMKPPAAKGKKGRRKRKIVAERTGNDRYLIYIGVFIALAIAVVIYYYKSVLNKPLPVIGMQEAHAQTITSLSKKKISFR